MKGIKHAVWILPLLVAVSSSCSLLGSDDIDADRALFVFSNTAQSFYRIDHHTFRVQRIPLTIPPDVRLFGMTLSTDRDHLFFSAHGPFPDAMVGFAVFDIGRGIFKDVFFTGIEYTATTRFASAENDAVPGLVFAHLRDHGTYAIDMFDQDIVDTISTEHSFILSKIFSHSPDGRWTVVHRKWGAGDQGSEFEFYRKGSTLRDLEFTLNANNRDSIDVYDTHFSEDSRSLFVSYHNSDGSSRHVEGFFSGYDIESGQMHQPAVRVPWSLNPYYLEYSPLRKEAYFVGAADTLYVVDTETYAMKDRVVLVGKTPGPSRILLRPDEKIAFVSCANTGVVLVVDLDRREVIRTIPLERPYTMIIP